MTEKRYSDCMMNGSNCSICALTSYNRDCHNNPINNIAYYRGIAGLTQQQLADRSGLHKQQVYKIENGKIQIENITLKNALSLAKALGISIDDLLEN